MTRSHPPATPHGPLEQLFDDVFFVAGSVSFGFGVPMQFSRNMVVLRHGDELTLVNSVRLDDDGLRALDDLGTVKRIIRIAGFHGMDDPFYAERAGAPVWALSGQHYTPGVGIPKAENAYFEATHALDDVDVLPVPGAKLLTFPSAVVPEGMLLLERDGGILITGDALQNWTLPDPYFSTVAKVMMRVMGFIKPFNLGPGWVKATKPSGADVGAILSLDFDHVLPCHGQPVIGGAKDKFRPVIERYASRRG